MCDQLYCNCERSTGCHHWAVEFMRQYYAESSRATPEPETRQSSWNSNTSIIVSLNPTQTESAPTSNLSLGEAAVSSPADQQRRRAGSGLRRESCPHCGYTPVGTDRRKLLRRHMLTHKDTEELFECGFLSLDGSVCSKTYNRPDNLRSHQRKEFHTHAGRQKRLLRKRLPRGARFRPDID